MKCYLPFVIVGVAASTVLTRPLLCQTMQPQRLTISGDEPVSARHPAESVHIRGNPAAAVTLEEFGDFECPSCANLATFLDQVVKEYHPRARLIFRNFPLSMHQYARDAAQAAEAAGLQGRYWEMHDVLYREQPVWTSSGNNARRLFISYAETLGLDLDRFQKDMQSDKVRERIEADQARAKSLGVKTAPSLFVDRREMGPNDRNPKGVRRLVDEAVKAESSTSEKK